MCVEGQRIPLGVVSPLRQGRFWGLNWIVQFSSKHLYSLILSPALFFPYVFIRLFVCLETRSHVAQAGLKFAIYPKPAQDCRHE